MLELGVAAPNFRNRKGADGKSYSLSSFADKPVLVVIFSCNGGVCTPHVFAFDRARKLRYRGRIDDSKYPSRVGSHDLRNALDDLILGKEVSVSLDATLRVFHQMDSHGRSQLTGSFQGLAEDFHAGL